MIAIAFGTINVVGGFLVTDRMLDMFKKRPAPTSDEDDSRCWSAGSSCRTRDVHRLGYIVAFSMFIVGPAVADQPAHGARGNMIAAVGMAIAVAATLLRRAASATGA